MNPHSRSLTTRELLPRLVDLAAAVGLSSVDGAEALEMREVGEQTIKMPV